MYREHALLGERCHAATHDEKQYRPQTDRNSEENNDTGLGEASIGRYSLGHQRNSWLNAEHGFVVVEAGQIGWARPRAERLLAATTPLVGYCRVLSLGDSARFWKVITPFPEHSRWTSLSNTGSAYSSSGADSAGGPSSAS